MNIYINLYNYCLWVKMYFIYLLIYLVGVYACVSDVEVKKKVIMRMKNEYFIKITFRIDNQVFLKSGYINRKQSMGSQKIAGPT